MNQSAQRIRNSCGQEVAVCPETYLHDGSDPAAAIRKHQPLEKVRKDEAPREEQKAREALPQRFAALRRSLTVDPVAAVPHLDFRVYCTSSLRNCMMNTGIPYDRAPGRMAARRRTMHRPFCRPGNYLPPPGMTFLPVCSRR